MQVQLGYTGTWGEVNDTECLELLSEGVLETLTDNFKTMAREYGLQENFKGYAEVALRAFENAGAVKRGECPPYRQARLEWFCYDDRDTGLTKFRVTRMPNSLTDSIKTEAYAEFPSL